MKPHAPYVHHSLSSLFRNKRRSHGLRRVPGGVYLYTLCGHFETQSWGLLCVLFIRHRPLSSCPEGERMKIPDVTWGSGKLLGSEHLHLLEPE